MKTIHRTGTSLALAALICVAAGALTAETVHYAYDEAGRLLGVHFQDGTSISYVYDPSGNLLRKRVATFTDTDGDGMDDEWERTHFGDLSRDGRGDWDGDGASDLAEFMAGTDPKSPGSVLQVAEVRSAAGAAFRLEWAAVPGKLYRVQYNDTLRPQDWRDLPGDIVAGGSTAAKADESAASAPRRFYRIVVLP